jgi:hypothetical protein
MRCPVWPGSHARRHVDEAGLNLAVLCARGRPRRGLPVRRRRRGAPSPAEARSLGVHHGVHPGRGASAALRLPGRRPVGPRGRHCGSTPRSCCSTPTPGRSRRCDRRRPLARDTRAARPRARERPPRLARRSCRAASSSTTTSTGATTAPPARLGATPCIYELHVKGFTMRHPDVPPHLRGTYAGLGHPAVGRAPARPRRHRGRAAAGAPLRLRAAPRCAGLTNYWGYNSLGFFAPHAAYSAAGPRRAGARVQGDGPALHAAGIEVILDVVYNHTAEGGHARSDAVASAASTTAATTASREDPPATRLHRHRQHPRRPVPHVLQLIMDSLRYWVTEMHVDGFRFDLAAALARSFHDVDMLSSFLDDDPRTRCCAGQAHRRAVGRRARRLPGRGVPAPGPSGTTSTATPCATSGAATPAASASWPGGCPAPPTCTPDGRRPWASINFVTAHDGFTLRDLVTTTASTTRPTARTTATAPTTTGRGTAAWRARPTTPRSRRCAAGRRATC